MARSERGKLLGLGAEHPSDPVEIRRQVLADFCRLVGARLRGEVIPNNSPATAPDANVSNLPPLSPRARQTLELLLEGDSEKQIALKLKISPHTIHVYVKALYRGFEVNSRGELMAKFVNGGERLAEIPRDDTSRAAG